MSLWLKQGNRLKKLIQDVYDLVGSFAFDRDDLHLKEEQKQAIIARCKNNPYQSFGKYNVQSLETIDGFKFNLSDDEWVMMRPSGTEPVLRVYAQAATHEGVRAILDATKEEVLGGVTA